MKDLDVGKPTIEIDGARFDDIDGFWTEVSNQVVPGADWGRNLDAFNDILRGGFGTPEGGFVLRWKNSERSREKLGYAETAKYWDSLANGGVGERKAEAARRKEGPTLFDTLIGIIQTHTPGGREADDGVDLELV